MKKIIIFSLLFLLKTIITYANQESVICIHGFFRSSKCMIPMKNTLKKEGFNVYLWDYQSRKQTINQHAENLIALIKTIAAQNPGKPIHFTTHSFGGIILRASLNHPDCPEEAKQGKAILLAPPNKGAALARHFCDYLPVKWFFGKKAGGELLMLDESSVSLLGQFPSTMDLLVIAGEKPSRFFGKWVKEPNDGKVTVEETRLSTPHEHCTLFVGHNWIMTSREAISLAKEFLLRP